MIVPQIDLSEADLGLMVDLLEAHRARLLVQVERLDRLTIALAQHAPSRQDERVTGAASITGAAASIAEAEVSELEGRLRASGSKQTAPRR